MASESTDEQTMSVSLPADLSEWLDQRADALDVDRETLLVQLLASYRMTADGETPADIAVVEGDNIDEVVQERLDDVFESVLTERINEATNSVQRQLGDRMEALEADYRENLEDVRQRVIQVKKETDGKAPASHDHPELAQVEDIEATLDGVRADVADLREEFDDAVPEHATEIAALDDRLETIEGRLQTVAWVVSDLREAQESGGLGAVERLKRAAAKANVERANCENCGKSVAIALLTDPQCPHCSATVSDVEPSSGWFGNPKLETAAQLESGEER